MTQWNDIGYVVSSKYRIAALRQLTDGPCTPTTISREEELQISHISRALKGLRENGLVELLVPEERKKGRIYSATEDGEEIWDGIICNDMEPNNTPKTAPA